MSIPARSKGACWTCRLRRKKCDEGQPICSTCTTLSVDCYGYDPKPAWADGGILQKEKAEELRCAIKTASSQKRRKTMRQRSLRVSNEGMPKESSVTVRLAEVGGDSHDTVIVDSRTHIFQASCPETKLLEPASSGDLKNSIVNLGPVPYRPELSISPTVLQDTQAILLMHYLDYVFPLQFPLYCPSPSDGGRGWLLSILLQTKPLCHAALSLAAYHQASLKCNGRRVCCRTKVLEIVQKWHSLALAELRDFLDGHQKWKRPQSFEENVEVLACIVLLISLEFFMGHTESWKIHLEAALALLPGLQSNHDLSEDISLSYAHQKALHFFSGVVAWYDILSYTTPGAEPLKSTALLAQETGQIQFDKIMGCENWVMLLIIEIATLDEWRVSSQKNGCLSMPNLVGQAARIGERLEEGLARISKSTKDVAELSTIGTMGSATSTSISSIITRIFACAALVYLHVVVSGPQPELPEIQKSVSETIAAFEVIDDWSIMKSLTWPLTIAGCMATGEQKDFFRVNLSSAGDQNDLDFGNFRRCFEIIEECWRMRHDDRNRESSWTTSMSSLDLHLLLV